MKAVIWTKYQGTISAPRSGVHYPGACRDTLFGAVPEVNLQPIAFEKAAPVTIGELV